jgi:hypothetical protein
MKSWTRAIGPLLGLLFLVAGCHDNGTGPEPAEYLLYAGMAMDWPETPEPFVAIIDCQIDSVIDSLFYSFEGAVTASGSPDGRFLGTQSAADPPVVIWDAATKEPLAGLPKFTGALAPLFVPDAGLVITPERGVTRISNSFAFSESQAATV